ncbi:MAG: hypothetical protein RL145_1748 [Pseudomonadota bacterium]|jgi:hypothetical protein
MKPRDKAARLKLNDAARTCSHDQTHLNRIEDREWFNYSH